MRILLATQPFEGHFAPAYTLVARLCQRGHEVGWYTGEKYRSAIEGIGARYVPMRPLCDLSRRPEDFKPAPLKVCIERFQGIQAAQESDLLADMLDHPPDVVLADPSVLAGPTAARAEAVPFVLLGILPLLYGDPEMHWIAQATIEGFEFPHPELPNVAYVGPLLAQPSLMGKPPPWWDGHDPQKPLIHVTQGTISSSLSELVLPTLEALADVPVEVIATAKPHLAPELLPRNAFQQEWVNHRALIPHLALLVTNGGYSAVSNALACGVPVLVIGATEDKPEVGQRVMYAGNGLFLETRTPKPKAIRELVMTILATPRFRERAHELALRCARTDAATTIAMMLEHLVPAWTGRPLVNREEEAA
jgi:UDP:flavonoid glycosyltransferase YjiC (YdhE family)